MNNSWLKELKEGSRVFVCSNEGKSLEVVQRITPKGRVVVNNTQYTNGFNFAHVYNIRRLEEATATKIWEYKTQCFAIRVFHKLMAKKSITYEQAKKINEILELGVEE
jgi:hypothetical protein